MKKIIKLILVLIGIWMPIAWSGVLAWTFFLAHSDPTDSVLVTVNRYHEAALESVMFPVGLAIAIMVSVYVLRLVLKDTKAWQ